MATEGQPAPAEAENPGFTSRRSSWMAEYGGTFALLVALLIAVLDQYTKHIARRAFRLGDSIPVIPGFFDLTHITNTGAAWGMFGGANAALTILSVVLLLLMVIFRRSFLSDTWDHRLALGLLIGGIVGNVMDRIRLGAVTDFLDFHWRGHHWPAFNVADSAICIGVGIYILSSLWLKRHPLHEPAEPSADPPKAADVSG